MHKCIICIGSNYNRKENLLLARKRLADLFPSIRFTPNGKHNLCFSGVRIVLQSSGTVFLRSGRRKSEEGIESYREMCRRRPEDKKEEKVCLDIDLLSFDDRVLKPEDLKREYIVKGLEELK